MRKKDWVSYVYITCESGEESKLIWFDGSVGLFFNLLLKIRKLWIKS